MERDMKRAAFLLTILLTFGWASLCLADSADILKRYAGHEAVADAANKSGFSIKDTGTFQDMATIDIYFSNPRINQNEDNNKVATSRLQIFNAEDLSRGVSHDRASSKTTTTKPDGTSVMYYGARFFIKNPKPGYAIVFFKGIPAGETAEAATPPSFFIIELGQAKPRLLTPKPLLAKDLFQ
jgi:hypothetical protein